MFPDDLSVSLAQVDQIAQGSGLILEYTPASGLLQPVGPGLQRRLNLYILLKFFTQLRTHVFWN